MKRSRKTLCILLAAALLLNGCASAGTEHSKAPAAETETAMAESSAAQEEPSSAKEETTAAPAETSLVKEGTYPTEWDLTLIYDSAEEWQADYDNVMAKLPLYADYRGKLNTAQGLYDYLEFAYLGELTRLQSRLSLYAYLGYSLNPADPVFNEMMTKLSVMDSKELQYGAFVDSELFSLPLEQRQKMMDDPILKPFAYALKQYVDPEHEPLSEETNTVLATLSPSLSRSEMIYDIMLNVEVPDPQITMPDGTVKALTDALYNSIVYSDEYDRDFKALCNQTTLTKGIAYANTFAALLETTVLQNWADAQIEGYETSREAALDVSDVDPRIYDMVIAAARKGAPDYQRYLNLHKEGLGLDIQYPFDTATSVSDYAMTNVPYDNAVEEVRQALQVLGDDYLAYYDELISSGHMDIYPTDTKTSGAFSMSLGDEFRAFQMFNYTGIPGDVSTIAHEMGHAIYSSYAMDHQDSFYQSPTSFTQEVASTTNELLYYTYMINQASDDDEKLFYLENVLNTFGGTFFIQALYAEFEDAMYQTIEAGGSLNAEMLSDKWMELFQIYRGDSVEMFPDSRYRWITIPHFYYNYYVYQYATSISYAASICEQIKDGDESVVEQYKNFLKLGSSAPPDELLRTAGIDPLEEETYQKALDFFGDLVDEYERLIKARDNS